MRPSISASTMTGLEFLQDEREDVFDRFHQGNNRYPVEPD